LRGLERNPAPETGPRQNGGSNEFFVPVPKRELLVAFTENSQQGLDKQAVQEWEMATPTTQTIPGIREFTETRSSLYRPFDTHKLTIH